MFFYTLLVRPEHMINHDKLLCMINRYVVGSVKRWSLKLSFLSSMEPEALKYTCIYINKYKPISNPTCNHIMNNIS